MDGRMDGRVAPWSQSEALGAGIVRDDWNKLSLLLSAPNTKRGLEKPTNLK